MMFVIYSLTPAPWGDHYRYVEGFDTEEDAKEVLLALEKVNILFNCYKIFEENPGQTNCLLRAENRKLAEQLLRIDNYCRVNDIDIEAICSSDVDKKINCACCGGTGKPCSSCGEYHPSICMCPPHEVRMKWAKNICPDCGTKEPEKQEEMNGR